nr:hypothetical protein [Tanacetum cinerariifolium]
GPRRAVDRGDFGHHDGGRRPRRSGQRLRYRWGYGRCGSRGRHRIHRRKPLAGQGARKHPAQRPRLGQGNLPHRVGPSGLGPALRARRCPGRGARQPPAAGGGSAAGRPPQRHHR